MATDRVDVLVLDGGVATELRRGGLSLSAPWWGSRALLTEANRQALRAVHEAFVAAGARVLTANTFRANLRALRQTRLDDAGRSWMVHAAIGVAAAARTAAGVDGVLIAGSIGPVEDCYRPDLVPGDPELRAEHGWLARQLSRTGVDLYLIETMNTVREARIALAQVRDVGGRAWVSLVCTEDGRLLSGEGVGAAARILGDEGAEVVLVNCTSPAGTEVALRAIRAGWSGPVGAYPNIEDRSGLPAYQHVDQYLNPALTPAEFGATVARWRADYGASVLGGCCGSTPDHLSALCRVLAGSRV